ncbi:MAG: hypothetical protein EPN61_07845 [Burkholderiaceae bacterium]|nr:MAG: hypothetical protein EPN61_07845 [Burkholderiaceae bacterium]
MPAPNSSISGRSLTLCALGILLSASALAAGSRDTSQAQAQYQRDRAACNAGQSSEDRATCLKEAGAALQAARSGQLTSESPADYQRNALRRCDEQPPRDRQDCVARMQNPAQGSVDGGGLLRQAQTPVQ